MKKIPKSPLSEEDFLDMCDVVSSCECTGLMPTLPHGAAQQEAYEKLFSMEVSQSEEEGQCSYE